MDHGREVRLGIVLYGGVSLAVYENGVAQELHRAVRGDGVYELLKYLVDSEIIVDIVSGTSAGGVNGIMLAHALANKRRFSPSADLWRDQADIQALLRSEGDGVATSILDSTYYQDKLQKCFQDGLSPDPTAPAIKELDLFITGTDANGDISTVYDDQGHLIDVKNHRALFRLQVRSERKNDLKSATAADLAKLARITSCFPVAFEPVQVGSDDKLFFLWGKLRKPAVYLDGGILNNKPFTSTLDAISRRTANGDVERFLLYVEPDPEVFGAQASGTEPNSPSVVHAASSALLSIPGYQSIAADLEAIEAHNERAQRISELFNTMGDAPEAAPDGLDRANVVPESADPRDTAYLAARLIQLRDTAVGSILNDEHGRGYFSSLEDRRSGRILVESFDNWPGEGKVTLKRYDVFFRIRRAAHLSRSLMRLAKKGGTVPQSSWDLVNHFFKLYEIAEWAMVSWLDAWTYPWRKLCGEYPQLDTLPAEQRRRTLANISVGVWQEVEKRLQLLLQADIHVPPEPTSAARSTYYDQLRVQLKSDGPPPAAVSPNNLLDAIDNSFRAAVENLGTRDAVGRLLRSEFCRFIDVDRQLFPIQIGSGFESINTVRVVRFSPRDAQRGLSKGDVSQKVCGSALGAFGGFFKKSWRANDIMMGRLDAACLMVECLLTKERIAALAAGRTVTETQLAKWFPHIGQGTASLAETINTYLAAPRDANQSTWSDLVDKIVDVAHNEIQLEEWPLVFQCGLEQEYDWGRYLENKRLPGPRQKKSRWKRPGAKPDQILVAAAASAIASGQLPPFTPGAVAGRRFLDEVPDTVLQELGFLSTIRLGKSLLASVSNPETRKRLEGSGIYKWPFAYIAPILYRWARVRRTKPDSVIIFNTAVPVACLTVLMVDLALMVFGLHPHLRVWAGLFGIPLVLLVVWGFWFRK